MALIKGNRIPNFDFLKGLLIVLVVVGHVLLGSLDKNFTRFIIYAFHMPLFIGLSGYLLNSKKLSVSPTLSIVKNYFYRLILPWSISVVVYFLITWQKEENILYGVFRSFIVPFYHLWYVPAFLAFLFISLLFIKAEISFKWRLIISGLISLVSYYLIENSELYDNWYFFSDILSKVFHTIRPQFLFFFIFGGLLKEVKFKTSIVLSIFFLALFFFLYTYFSKNDLFSSKLVFFYCFNSLLLVLTIYVANKSLLSRSRPLEWLGRNSLAVYLWHVVPLIFIRGEHLYYLMSFFAEILLIALIWKLSKISPINKYVFGMNNNKRPN